MSIDRLRYFAAVVETRNLRKAAELVNISPPSMSKAISVLEGELGCKLLHPEGRGIGITPKGLEVYRSSLVLLEEHRRFYQRLKEGAKANTRLRLASFEVFSTYFISTFLTQVPDLDILLLEKTPGGLEHAILAGVVDYGITYLPSPNPSLEYTEIGHFQFGVFGTKKWQNADFQKWPFAIPTTELNIQTSDIDSLDMWPKSAPKRLVKYQFELLETALQTSRQGLSVLHCPDFIIRLQNEFVKTGHQLISLATPPGYKRPKAIKIYLVCKKGVETSPLEGKLATFLRFI